MPRRSNVRPVGRVEFRSGPQIRPLTRGITNFLTNTEWRMQRLLTLTVPRAFVCGSEECIQYSYLSLLFTPRHKSWKYVHNCISHLEVAATVAHRVQRITPHKMQCLCLDSAAGPPTVVWRQWNERCALSGWIRLSQIHFFPCLLSSFVEHTY